MRFYTKQHPFYCGIDWHARSMYVCILNQEGESLLHRNMQASPETLLKAIAPYREAMVVAVACLFTWYGLAALGAPAGIPFVLGYALSMQAIHGGTATNDTIDAHTIAVVLRGGMLPHASVYPADMRATRDLLRRRMSLTRKRAELLAHLQNTHSQYTLPEIGQKLAYQANRDGGAERFPAPAVHKSLAVDLALLGSSDPLLRDLELPIVTAAKPHAAHTLSRLQTVPGIGTILRRVLLYAMHDIQRFPRVQDVVSSCRFVTCARASAGTRSGTAGAKSGNASLTWAFSAAAVLLLRDHPAGQQSLTRLEKTHGQGQAVTLLAQQLGRAVSDRLQRHKAFDMHKFLHAECAEWVSLTPNGTCTGSA
jgi:transposase